jgi:putative transposase
MNRGNERQKVFHTDTEYSSFLQLLERAQKRQPMRILAFSLMPNHFHLCVWPHEDGDIARYMQWLMTAHVWQFRKSHPGHGHVWQGRYKSFPVQDDHHLLVLIQYVERNPVRAGLVDRAEDWPWSSAGRNSLTTSPWPVPNPPNWLELLGRPEEAKELAKLRECVN